MKRLLVVTTEFPPSRSIGTRRILRICKYLSPVAWSVSVVTPKERYYEVSDSTVGREVLDRIRVHRTGKWDVVGQLTRLRNSLRDRYRRQRDSRKPAADDESAAPGFARRFVDALTDLVQFPDKQICWLPTAVWAGYRVIKREDVHVIFSSSPPHSTHIASSILKLLTGRRLVVDFRDPWARSPWHDEVRTLNAFERLKHRWIRQLERWVVSRADAVLLITPEMRDDFATHYATVDQSKFQVFSNGYDPESLRIVSAATPADVGGVPKVTFIHTGSLYKYRDPMPLLTAVANLARRGDVDPDRLALVFVGTVDQEFASITRSVEQPELRGLVTFMPATSYEEAMGHLIASDVAVLLQPQTTLQLPGKFFDYVCVGKPILAVGEKGSAVERAVGEGFGIFADYNDVESVESALLFLYGNPGYNRDWILRNRSAFDMSRSIQRLSQVLGS